MFWKLKTTFRATPVWNRQKHRSYCLIQHLISGLIRLSIRHWTLGQVINTIQLAKRHWNYRISGNKAYSKIGYAFFLFIPVLNYKIIKFATQKFIPMAFDIEKSDTRPILDELLLPLWANPPAVNYCVFGSNHGWHLTNEANRPRLHRGDERSRGSEKLREKGRQCRWGPSWAEG